MSLGKEGLHRETSANHRTSEKKKAYLKAWRLAKKQAASPIA